MLLEAEPQRKLGYICTDELGTELVNMLVREQNTAVNFHFRFSIDIQFTQNTRLQICKYGKIQFYRLILIHMITINYN